jgi:hypothetical protein
MAARNHIFNITEVLAALRPQYEASLEKKDLYNEDGSFNVAVTPFWAGILSADWVMRKGANGTSRTTINCRIGNIQAPLTVKVFNETHIGKVAPLRDEDVAAANAANKNPKFIVKKRDKGVTLQVYKQAKATITGEDGVARPNTSAESNYFKLAEIVDVFMQFEVEKRSKVGLIVQSSPIALKQQKEGKLSASALLISNPKVAPLVARTFSTENADKNIAGADRTDPCTRVRMDFDKDSQMATTKIHNKNCPYVDPVSKITKYEVAKVNGVPVNGYNIHEFLTSNSTWDGIVQMDNICISNMGISVPVRASVAVVTPAVFRNVDTDDLYAGMSATVPDTPATVPATPVTPATPATASSSTPAVPKVANASSDETDNLLNELNL